jgi:hypothetical protein
MDMDNKTTLAISEESLGLKDEDLQEDSQQTPAQHTPSGLSSMKASPRKMDAERRPN